MERRKKQQECHNRRIKHRGFMGNFEREQSLGLRSRNYNFKDSDFLKDIQGFTK